MAHETLVILNPESAGGATGRRRELLLARIESSCGPVALQSTRAPGDAFRMAREATLRGMARILVAGGDGTNSEVAAGVLSVLHPGPKVSGLEPHEVPSGGPVLGLLPFGSGWDLARALELPRGLDAALAVIAAGASRTIDAGRVEFRDARGVTGARFFVNEVSAGLSGSAVALVGRTSKRVGARAGFIVGAIGAILSHRPLEVAIELDGARVYEGPVSMVVAANGRFFGAGMCVAPQAELDDGRLEVVIVRGLATPRLLANLPSLYRGRHGRHESVSFHAAKRVEVTPKGDSAPIDLDGESVGRLPLSAEVIPRALRVFAPAGSERRA